MFLRYFDKVLPIPKVGPNPKLQGCLPNELFARISHRVDERVIDLEVQTVDYTVDCDGIKTCLKCSTVALFTRLACLVCPDEPLLCILWALISSTRAMEWSARPSASHCIDTVILTQVRLPSLRK